VCVEECDEWVEDSSVEVKRAGEEGGGLAGGWSDVARGKANTAEPASGLTTKPARGGAKRRAVGSTLERAFSMCGR
jgi:hypothetical protein